MTDYMGFQEIFPCGSREEGPTSEGLKSFSWSSVEAASQQGSPYEFRYSGELVLGDESHTNFSLLLDWEMRGYGYITVASGAVYLQRESVLENTRILTSRKHTRRQKREWKKDPMLASRYSLQTLRQPKFSCKVLRSSPSLPIYTSTYSIKLISHTLLSLPG